MTTKLIITKHGQKGYALIEVMIAVVLFAIGLLGYAGLQAVGIRVAHTAHLRSQAILLTYNVIDRTRSNQNRDNNGYYIHDYGNYTNDIIEALTDMVDCTTKPNGCDSDEMADNDMIEWRESLTKTLPGAQGEVCRDSTWGNDTTAQCDFNNCDGSGNTYVIRIQWQEEETTQCLLTTFLPILL